MRLHLIITSLILMITTLNSFSHGASSIKDSIIKIYTFYNRYDYNEPWQMEGQSQRSGSGSIIRGNRILTNAHVVGDHTYIQVRRTGEAKKYQAEVEVVSNESDLAILTVNDKSFFDGIKPLDFGSLPKIRDKVAAYGFPIGGDELSITEGIVSRVEHQRYTHSHAYLLACQIDAAINPGNSGGPVIKSGKIVGVAFQAGRGENIGYMVPVPVINHFLEDIKDNNYEGFPGLGISWQKLESPDLREKLKMSSYQTGVLVNKIFPDSPADGLLLPDDIIMAINDTPIENNGTVEFRKGERTFFGHLIQMKQLNEKINLKILRNGNTKYVEIVLSKSINSFRLVPYQRYGIPPTYYINGGMVFSPLTANLLKSGSSRSSQKLVNYYLYGEQTRDRKEIIILLRVLADEINTGYQDWSNNIITHVNGKKISTIKDLISNFEKNTGKFHVLEVENGNKLIISKQKVDKNSKRILEKYKINFGRSEDLK